MCEATACSADDKSTRVCRDVLLVVGGLAILPSEIVKHHTCLCLVPGGCVFLCVCVFLLSVGFVTKMIRSICGIREHYNSPREVRYLKQPGTLVLRKLGDAALTRVKTDVRGFRHEDFVRGIPPQLPSSPGLTPRTPITWTSDDTLQGSGWRLCIEKYTSTTTKTDRRGRVFRSITDATLPARRLALSAGSMPAFCSGLTTTS